MSKKFLVIIVSSIVTLAVLSGAIYYFFLSPKPVEQIENQEQKTEELAELPEMNIEIVDLEGPNQKYINHTLGYSLELPDELGTSFHSKESNQVFTTSFLSLTDEKISYGDPGFFSNQNRILGFDISNTFLSDGNCKDVLEQKRENFYGRIVEDQETILLNGFNVKKYNVDGAFAEETEQGWYELHAIFCPSENILSSIRETTFSDKNNFRNTSLGEFKNVFDKIVLSLKLLSN